MRDYLQTLMSANIDKTNVFNEYQTKINKTIKYKNKDGLSKL